MCNQPEVSYRLIFCPHCFLVLVDKGPLINLLDIHFNDHYTIKQNFGFKPYFVLLQQLSIPAVTACLQLNMLMHEK